MRFLRRLLRRDEGSALMFVAIGLPTMIVVFTIVVDVGDWYVHRRALQNQADAAVLAGSQLWGSCFKATGTTPLWLPMQQEAQNYDGEAAFANYNPQVGGPLKGTLGVAFNSKVFPISQPPNVGADDTPADPCALTTLADGQGHYVFDVKATEQNVPLIFGGAFLGLSGPNIHATARTELDQVKSLSGLLPIGVQDPTPEFMYAQFVDEDAGGAPLPSAPNWIPLCEAGAIGCSVAPKSGEQFWATETTTPVTISSANIGVRLKFVWAGSDPNAACGSTLADCFDAGSTNGLVHIRGWSGSDKVHAARLEPGTCTPDAYFAKSSCLAGITADIDLGSVPTSSTNVWAEVDGANQKYQLALQSTSGTLGTWSVAQLLPFDTTGPHSVALFWNCPTDNQGCPLGTVQRGFVSDSVRSGPVEGLHVWSPTSLTGGENSFARGTTQDLGISIDNPCFKTQAADPSCPTVILRVSQSGSGGGGQSQSLDCDPAIPNFRDEIGKGCSPQYTTFPQTPGETTCPNQTNLWSQTNPPAIWDCVAVEPGTFVGPMSQGFGDRIGTDAATCANNWPNFPANDKRQVPLFLVPYTAFNGTGGNTTYPVIGFGAFYVTGYQNDPCPGATQGVPGGEVAGHFITYLPAPKGATPSEKPCDPLGLTPCIPVLVK